MRAHTHTPFFHTFLSHWETLHSLSPLWESLWWGPESWHSDFQLFTSLSPSGWVAVETDWHRSSYHSQWKAVFSLQSTAVHLSLTNSTRRPAAYGSNEDRQNWPSWIRLFPINNKWCFVILCRLVQRFAQCTFRTIRSTWIPHLLDGDANPNLP